MYGGVNRNRTGVRGFADRCLTSRPSRPKEFRNSSSVPESGLKRNALTCYAVTIMSKHKKKFIKVSREELLRIANQNAAQATAPATEQDPIARVLSSPPVREAQQSAPTSAPEPSADHPIANRVTAHSVRADLMRIGWTAGVIVLVFIAAAILDQKTPLFSKTADFLFRVLHLS